MLPSRPLVRVLVVLLLLPLAWAGGPAYADPAPWRFKGVVLANTFLAAGGIGSVTASCGSGYVALGGGFATTAPTATIETVGEYRSLDGMSWTAVLHNYHSSTISIQAYPACALASDVDGSATVSAELSRNGAGIAGGEAACPLGQRAIGGGADWNVGAGNFRRIDTSAPSLDGRSWVVSGWSGENGATLHVEAYCVDEAGLGGVVNPTVTQADLSGTVTLRTVCPDGRRAVTGGVLTAPAGSGTPDPTTYRAVEERSEPSLPTDTEEGVVWSHTVRVEAGTRIIRSVWCLIASQPVVTIDSGPPAFTNATSATITFTASDPQGEGIGFACKLDGQSHTCVNGTAEMSSLSAGTHTYAVTIHNDSRQYTTGTHTWTVDLTPPGVTPPADPVPLAGPLTLTFNEPVQGASASSIQVRVEGSPTALPGTVSLSPAKTAASWTPTAPLIPGETYVVSTTPALTDRAGNSAPADTYPVSATGVAETSSPVFRETWDIDRARAAMGGRWATSRQRGASATWAFSATAGQKAVVYGVQQPTGGYADVYVDGVKKARVSFYRASLRHKVPVFTSAALGPGAHTLEVRVAGRAPSASRGTEVGVDALRLGGTTRQESLARYRFPRVSAAGASGGSYDTVNHRKGGDTGPAPTYTLTFKGTGIAIRATKSPGSGSAKVYVDGVLRKTINLRAAATSYQGVVATITGLSDTRHELTIVAVGTKTGKRSAVGIDRVDVT